MDDRELNISQREFDLVWSLSAENNCLRKQIKGLRHDYCRALDYIKKLQRDIREHERAGWREKTCGTAGS